LLNIATQITKFLNKPGKEQYQEFLTLLIPEKPENDLDEDNNPENMIIGKLLY